MSDSATIGMDFFWDYDNDTFPLFNLETSKVRVAEGPTFGVGAEFYSQSPSEFETSAKNSEDSLKIVKTLNDHLVTKHFTTYDSKELVVAFENFGMGVLFDERRNVAEPYKYWAVHSMDSISSEQAAQTGSKAIPPSGYYPWYGAIRGICMLSGLENFYNDEMHANWLHFGRALAIGAATQNIAKPFDVVGPSSYSGVGPSVPFSPPNNPQVSKSVMDEAIASFEKRYLPMTLKQLDEAFSHRSYSATCRLLGEFCTVHNGLRRRGTSGELGQAGAQVAQSNVTEQIETGAHLVLSRKSIAP